MAAVLMLVLMSTPALAKKSKVSATLQFAAPSHFSGKVSSKNADCKDGAKVSLLYYQSSADTTADTVGKGKTNKKGAYGIEVPNAIEGDYVVKVSASAACQFFLSTRMHF
jgi:hypothetical protein